MRSLATCLTHAVLADPTCSAHGFAAAGEAPISAMAVAIPVIALTDIDQREGCLGL